MDGSATQGVLAERRAFRRAPDGTIAVRRSFGADAVALLLSIIAPIAYLVITAMLVVLLFRLLPEGSGTFLESE